MSDMDTLPPLFISHGSPMTALEPREAGHFMQALGPAIDAAFGRPRAVLAISAHSLTREPVLLAAPRHEAVYDFGGFDPQLYTLRYDAPGAPELAGRALRVSCRQQACPFTRWPKAGSITASGLRCATCGRMPMCPCYP
jgi:aromatic ring-opening dioxygenase catalytic subunit (LigB family)